MENTQQLNELFVNNKLTVAHLFHDGGDYHGDDNFVKLSNGDNDFYSDGATVWKTDAPYKHIFADSGMVEYQKRNTLFNLNKEEITSNELKNIFSGCGNHTNESVFNKEILDELDMCLDEDGRPHDRETYMHVLDLQCGLASPKSRKSKKSKKKPSVGIKKKKAAL